MSRILTVNNTSYNYPDAGNPKGWGEEATGWAEEVTNVLADLKGPNDILQTTFTISNNQVAASDITGLIFDPGTVRSAVVQYVIYRTTDTNELIESGQFYLHYKSMANEWSISKEDFDDAGIVFSVLPTGQVQYTSSNLAGINYDGIITFRAQTLDQ